MEARDRTDLRDAVVLAGERFSGLVESLTPAEAVESLDAVDWTAAETGAHVVTFVRRSMMESRRALFPTEVAKFNQDALDEFTERQPARLASALREDLTKLVDSVAPAIDPERLFPFHCHVEVTIDQILAVVLGELLVHGRDIAVPLGAPWTINPHEASLVWMHAGSVLNGWLTPRLTDHLDETWEIQLVGEAMITLRFEHGGLDVVPHGTDQADVHLAVDPVKFLLATPYRRIRAADHAVAKLANYFEPV